MEVPAEVQVVAYSRRERLAGAAAYPDRERPDSPQLCFVPLEDPDPDQGPARLPG